MNVERQLRSSVKNPSKNKRTQWLVARNQQGIMVCIFLCFISSNFNLNQRHSHRNQGNSTLLVGRRSLLYTLLESKQLLRTESLIVDLGCGLDQVLQVCPTLGHGENADPKISAYATNLVRKFRRCMNSQWFTSSTLTTPHRFLRPRTDLPSIITLRSEPTTAKGITL
jgi:hypothetical protein